MEVRDLGRLSYSASVEIQKQVLEEVAAGAPDTLIFVEHDPVLTLGANFHSENLLHPTSWYENRGIQVLPSDRGGDVTFHSPGQLVAYPIFSLQDRGKDLHLWLRKLEESVISVLAAYEIEGVRFPPNTGVWVNDRKICAMGIKVRKWVSMHGLALNCSNSLEPFDWIIPCGIKDYAVTSITQELGKSIGPDEVKPHLIEAFRQI